MLRQMIDAVLSLCCTCNCQYHKAVRLHLAVHRILADDLL